MNSFWFYHIGEASALGRVNAVSVETRLTVIGTLYKSKPHND